MKKIIYLLAFITVTFSGCKRDDPATALPMGSNPELVYNTSRVSVPVGNPVAKNNLNDIIFNEMSTTHDFRWQNHDLNFIWSASQYSPMVAVGYKPADLGDITPIIHQINIQSGAWKSVHDKIIDRMLTILNTNNPNQLTKADIVEEDDPILPIIIFRLTDRTAITELYNLQNVRYIEPYGYWPDNNRSSSGCAGSSEPLNTSDWTTVAPGSLLPWNYNNVTVPSAWTLQQGNNIRIGIIDAGISSSQSLLGSSFKADSSNVLNRKITTDYTYGTSVYTSCAHGTSMSGLATGPRTSQNATSGVAYKASLHFIRGCNDVVLDESAELSGVKNALVRMGNLADIKIISMSIGTPFYSSTLYDGVSYAYNKGKMIFAAAGTSYSWTSWWGVIYPANFSQCIAVTGVKEDNTTCSSCHDGSAVQFTIPMERNVNSSRNSLSLALSGSTPTYIGGSSCATAMTAGVAALVWSANPNLSRSQVYTCLRNTASRYPSRDSYLGYGNVNAYAAVLMATGL